MKLIIASNNKNKVREIKEILGNHFEEVLSMREAGIDIDVIEDSTTFAENAKKKALETLALIPEGTAAVLADDSGLEVDALDGAPGVYSARFAGEGHDDKANNDKLLTLLKNVPDDKRTASFVCSMVLARHGMSCIEKTARCYGSILHAPVGENGFGYDPLFLSKDFNESFAVLTPEQKNSVSHRKKALMLICEALDSEK